jgi:hypothetical protein
MGVLKGSAVGGERERTFVVEGESWEVGWDWWGVWQDHHHQQQPGRDQSGYGAAVV